MFHKVFIGVMKRWHSSYKFHRTSHGCGIREAASWAWWNAWNPTDGARYWRNSYISPECWAENAKREKEWRDIFSQCLSREHQLGKKWKAFNELKVETYLERVRHDNISGMIELQKKIKKLEKTGKRKKIVDK